MISEDLLRYIEMELRVAGVCAVQIRYRGAKGVLMVDPTLEANSIVLRKSQVKYDCQQGQEDLDILEYNRFHLGYINRQIILLLATLGVPAHHFLESQLEYIRAIKDATFKDCSIFKNNCVEIGDDIFRVSPVEDLVRAIVNCGIDLSDDPFLEGVLKAIKRKGLQSLRKKSNFVPDQSARLIGVLD
jgi:RNA-dependent RNA polymerase